MKIYIKKVNGLGISAGKENFLTSTQASAQLLLEKYGDTGDELSALAEKLEENPNFLAGARIYIEGFTSFTEPQYRLIGILMKRADLTLSLTLPKADEDAFEYSETRLAKSRLIRLGSKLSRDVKITRLDGAYNVLPIFTRFQSFCTRTVQNLQKTATEVLEFSRQEDHTKSVALLLRI